ncbi:MAG: hypothetical protein ACR2QH_01505 [Geminicoccaceae bacterium]
MLDAIFDPIKRFLEERRKRAGFERLQATGELDRILDEARYVWVRGDQGDDFLHVYRKDDMSLGSELFSTYSREEAIWWIVQRHMEETRKKPAEIQ